MTKYDVFHQVRKHQGITQKEINNILKIDKGAITRRVSNLETKGYLIRINSDLD